MKTINVIDWHSVAESLPEEGERVLIATPSSVMIATLVGMTKNEWPSRPIFRSAESCASDAFCSIKYWCRLPTVPIGQSPPKPSPSRIEVIREDQTRFVIKGGDGGTRPGERGGDVNVTLVAPLDAMEALKRKINGDPE